LCYKDCTVTGDQMETINHELEETNSGVVAMNRELPDSIREGITRIYPELYCIPKSDHQIDDLVRNDDHLFRQFSQQPFF
jgi:hypothetical protein